VTRNDVLCPESSLHLQFWNRSGYYSFMDLNGNVLLNEMSSDTFFISRSFDDDYGEYDGVNFQQNYCVPQSLVTAWTTFLGLPAEVHFYRGECDCSLCNTTHLIYCFENSPDSESEEQIQSALDIAKQNRNPPRQPSLSLPSNSSFLTSEDAECILCHSSCTSTLCLDCGKKQKDGSTLILLDSGASRHCTPHFEDFISYKPYAELKFSTTVDKDTFVEKLGLRTVLMLHHGKII